jgi:predicted ATP-dependent endonuclease of OLD family
MKIFKIQIDNYRLLKCFSIDLEKELSLVIGKNNTGKTSILSALNKFLNQSDKNKFSFDDFNIEFKKELKAVIENPVEIIKEDFIQSGLKLKLFIAYDATDNLTNVSRVMMDLDPDNSVIILGFEYALNFEDYLKLKKDYTAFVTEENAKKAAKADYVIRSLHEFLQEHHANYFKLNKKSFRYDQATNSADEKIWIDLVKEEISIKEIVNFKFISAKRDVTNKEIDKTLSGQTSRIYSRTEASDEQNKAVEDFKDRLTETDTHLSDIYKSLFSAIVKKVKDFGGIKINESEIEIVSTLQHRELLEGNTTVIYKHDEDNQLPEHYNGLGYMNLISMIFEIEILVQEFKREKDQKPADINLLFIEEPEAHTHPQMQYVFIKNIKKLLNEGIQRKDGEKRDLQYIISTHSSCIVADSDFDDIKYLKKEDKNSVVAKNLKDLRNEYDAGTPQYQFLTQYLTISRAEIFFADKAVLIEGDTERILIPTVMRKIDIDEMKRFTAAGVEDPLLPLLSQNISIIEVGAYSQIFEKFIDFLGIKTLIITDLDATDNAGVKCPVADGVDYSNDAITFFFNAPTLQALVGYTLQNKLFNKVANVWTNEPAGKLCVVYQTTENGYNARSFEDGFIHINKAFINPIKADFKGLKNRDRFDDATKTSYNLADECIKKKTHFALDILYHSNNDLSNWEIPAYIKEGLLWLKED